MITFLFFIFFSTQLPAQVDMALSSEDVIHPYEEIRPFEKRNLFEMMESENNEEFQQEQQEDPEMRKFEDKKNSKLPN